MKMVFEGKKVKVEYLKSSRRLSKELYKSCGPFYILFSTFSVLEGLTTALSALIVSRIVAFFEMGNYTKTSMTILWVWVGVFLFTILVNVVSEYIKIKFNSKYYHTRFHPNVCKQYFDKVSKIEFKNFYDKNYANESFYCKNAISSRVFSMANQQFLDTISAGIACVVSIVLFGIFNWVYIPIGLVFGVAIFVVYFREVKRTDLIGIEMQKKQRLAMKYSSILTQPRALRELRGHMSVGKIYDDYKVASRGSIKDFKKYQNVWIRGGLFSSVLVVCCGMAMMTMSFFLIKNNLIGISGFAGIVIAYSSFMGSISRFAHSFGSCAQDLYPVQKYWNFIENDNNEKLNEDVKPEEFDSIEFLDVSFSYPNSSEKKESLDMVLSNINIKIKKGERVALVGSNGCGKTTLVSLVLKLYDPTKGKILFNGKDLCEANLNGYRKNFSVVNQNYADYVIPLKDAVSLSNPEKCKSQDIDNSLMLAGAGDVVEKVKTENGYDTWLSRNFDGIELSGGQKQKVAIARGLHKSANFYIVDEPTSAIDPIIEEQILTNILNQTKGKTAIIISHRLSLCTRLDKVLYMENGRVIECGTHANLMQKKGGKYREMFNKQAHWYLEK